MPDLPLRRPQIARLLPHAGAMCLLDTVEACDDDRIVCRATSHRDPGNPLRRAGVLRAVSGVEYAAQAMALHGALRAQSGRPREGYLVSVRDVRCHAATLDAHPGDLEIIAELLASDDVNVAYAFAIRAPTLPLLSGRATVRLEPG